MSSGPRLVPNRSSMELRYSSLVSRRPALGPSGALAPAPPASAGPVVGEPPPVAVLDPGPIAGPADRCAAGSAIVPTQAASPIHGARRTHAPECGDPRNDPHLRAERPMG